jgi:uncharacterized membrane protein YeiB
VAGLYLESPHDNTMFEALGSGGFALGVIGLCLLVGAVGRAGGAEGADDGGRARRVAGRVVAVVSAPLAAVGAMALTVYSVQVVVLWWWARIGYDLLSSPSNVPLGVMVLATLAGATLWRALFGRGPLERLFARITRTAFPASGTTPDAAPEPASEPRAQNVT